MPRLDDAGSDAGGAAVYLATCPQRDGSTAALAAVAAPDDRLAAAAAATAAVEEWAAVTGDPDGCWRPAARGAAARCGRWTPPGTTVADQSAAGRACTSTASWLRRRRRPLT